MSTLAGIRLHRLEVPLGTPYKLAFGVVRHFDTLLAEVEDAEGRTGLGEATVLPGYTDETVEGSWTLMRRLAGEAVGSELEVARERLLAQVAAAPFTVTALVTAIEMIEGAPELAVRQPARVPLLGLLHADGGVELEAEIDALLAQGFRTFKVKVGFDADADAGRVRRVQRAVRGRAAIRLDANQGYRVDDAKRFAAGLDPEGIELFEQPCAAGDWEAACAVAAVSTVPMMLDESIYGLEDVERAAQLAAARFIKLKLMKLGSVARLAAALERIRALGMEPVLGNGVACEIGCWMEAAVARGHVRNAGEMNGYLKQAVPLVENVPRFEEGAIVLEPGYRPRLDRAAVARVCRERAEFHRPSVLMRQ